jgi:hypothetical protein
MAMINLQVDVTGISLVNPLTGKNKIGFLSSITPDPILLTAFIVGTGLPLSNIMYDFGDAKNYNPNSIKTKRDNQKNNCAVIAAVGGTITSTAVQGDTGQTYVSLVGSAVSDPNIKGGVSLQSYKLNKARKNYLNGLSARGTNYDDTNIYLYRNQNSAMAGDEATAWGAGNAGTIIPSSAGAAGAGTNDPSRFAIDFSAKGALDPAGPAKGLIISDDPFFRSSRGELIKQVNSWLNADTSRYVVYPSQFYGSPLASDLSGALQQPTAGQSILYGPDLVAAYHLLGMLARCCYENPNASPGFISPTPLITVVL